MSGGRVRGVALVNRAGCSIGDVGYITETFRDGGAKIEFHHRIAGVGFDVIKFERLNRSEWTKART